MPKPPRRTGLDECFHYLGEIGALMFFARAALDPDVKGVDLLRWTLRLQNALLTHPAYRPLKRLTIAAPQISTWRKANPIDWTPPPSDQSLSLRMLVIEVVSDADVSATPEAEPPGHPASRPRTPASFQRAKPRLQPRHSALTAGR